MQTQEQREGQSSELIFPYFEGSVAQLADEITQRRQTCQLSPALEQMMKNILGDSFSYTQLQRHFFSSDGSSLELQLAPHLAKPDIMNLSASALTKVLNRAGYPTRLTIRTLPDDIFVDESQDINGIKPAYLTPPVFQQTPLGPNFCVYPLADPAEVQGKQLRQINVNGVSLSDYHAAQLSMAGIDAAVVDGSNYHSAWLQYLVRQEGPIADKDLRKSRLFVRQDDGSRSAISVETAIAQCKQMDAQTAELFLSKLSPSADLYYRLVPTYLGGFIDGSSILLESYEDDQNFLKRVLSGVKKLETSTGKIPLVAQSAWLSGIDEQGSPIFNEISTQWNTTLTSLTVPVDFIGNRPLQQRYYQRITQQMFSQYDDISKISLTQLHRDILALTIEFLYNRSNFDKLMPVYYSYSYNANNSGN